MVQVVRDGEPKTLYVTLTDRDVALAAQQGGSFPTEEDADQPALELGIAVRDLSREDREDFDTDIGVIVQDIEPGSPADEQGIVPGDLILEINGREIDNSREFVGAMNNARDAKRPVRVLLGRVLNNGDLLTQYIALRFDTEE